MHLRPPLLALLLATSATTQSFEPDIGLPLGAGDETLTQGLALGFPFPFPDGTATSTVDVTSNGRILLPSTGLPDFSPSINEWINRPSALAPFWSDLEFGTPDSDDIYFNALPGKAVITYRDAVRFNGSQPFTVQAQLFADGTVWFLYDMRVDTVNSSPLVGVSGGPGASAAIEDLGSGYLASSATTLFESFTSTDFDLRGLSLKFSPDGSGGWDVIRTVNPFARTLAFGAPCERSFRFTPDGAGGYLTTNCAGPTPCFDVAVGVLGADDLGLGDEAVSGPLALGFPFTMPGGSTTSEIAVTSNGRIFEPGADTARFVPTLDDLAGASSSTLAPLWIDLDPSSGGAVLFATAPGRAIVTWNEVPQWRPGAAVGPRVTFQVTLHDDGSFEFAYQSTERRDETLGTAIVGFSAGNSSVGAETDLRAGLPATYGTEVYQAFPIGTPLDYQLELEGLTPPVLGTSLDVRLAGLSPSTATAAVLIGLFPVGIDLAVIGFPGCILYTVADVTSVPLTFSSRVSDPFSFGLPNDPTAVGVKLYYQGVAIDPSVSNSGLALSHGLELEAGYLTF